MCGMNSQYHAVFQEVTFLEHIRSLSFPAVSCSWEFYTLNSAKKKKRSLGQSSFLDTKTLFAAQVSPAVARIQNSEGCTISSVNEPKWHHFWRESQEKKGLTWLRRGTADSATAWPPASFRWEKSDWEMPIWGINTGSNAESGFFFFSFPATTRENERCLLCIGAWNCSARRK